MNCTVVLDWKSFAALSLGIIGVIFATKMNSEQAKEVSTSMVDACKEIGSRKITD